MDSFLQDLRYSLRKLVRAPAFTIVAVFTLALAIGATTAVFSLVDGVLLKSLPFRDPDRLVRVQSLNGQTPSSVSQPDFLDYRAQSHTVSPLAAFATGSANLTAAGAEPMRIQLARVGAVWFDLLGVRHAVPRRLPEESEVLLTPGDYLRAEQIVGFEAQSPRPSRVFVPDLDEALPPSWRQDSGLFGDALGVITEGLMEGRQFADAALDEVGAFGVVQWKKVSFDGDAHRLRSVGELTQDRLAADDHNSVVVGDDRGSADEVLELFPGHGPCRERSRASRQIFHRSCGRRAPANGLEWRSSAASSLRSTRKAATEEASPFRISAHSRA